MQEEPPEATANAQPHGKFRESHSDAATAQPAFGGVVEFGPFRLRPVERVLEKDGVPLKIGSRALSGDAPAAGAGRQKVVFG